VAFISTGGGQRYRDLLRKGNLLGRLGRVTTPSTQFNFFFHPTDARPGFGFNPGITTRDPENFQFATTIPATAGRQAGRPLGVVDRIVLVSYYPIQCILLIIILYIITNTKICGSLLVLVANGILRYANDCRRCCLSLLCGCRPMPTVRPPGYGLDAPLSSHFLLD
jgi:hypothetical protein